MTTGPGSVAGGSTVTDRDNITPIHGTQRPAPPRDLLSAALLIGLIAAPWALVALIAWLTWK